MTVRFIALTSALLLSTAAYAAGNPSQDLISARTAPIGHVAVAGDVTQARSQAQAAIATKATPGGAVTMAQAKHIYDSKCMACHTTGAAGAPKIGDASAWKTRLKQGKAQLVEHAIKGFKLMPAKGTCMECTDEELRATVDYILKESGGKA